MKRRGRKQAKVAASPRGIIVVCCYCLSVSVAAGVCACVGDCLWFETAAGRGGGCSFYFPVAAGRKKNGGGVSLHAIGPVGRFQCT